MPDAVIDLGELTDDGPGPSWAAPPWRPPRWSLRRVLPAVVAVLATATLTASVHHEPSSRAATIPAGAGDLTFAGRDDYVVVSDTADPPGSPVENKIVNVYALPSATRTSRTAVTVTGPILSVVAVDGLVLVSYQSDGAGNVATAAYTAGTERTVWRRYGRLFGLSPSGRRALLADIPEQARAPRWYGIDVRSGHIAWRSDLPPTADALGSTDPVPAATETSAASGAALTMVTVLVTGVGDQPERLVAVTPDGRIEVRDLDTGRITAGAKVPVPAQWRTMGPQIGVGGGLLLLATSDRDTIAYDLRDLSERWRSPLRLSGRWVQPACGDVICLFEFGGGIQVLDTDTGRQLWKADGWGSAQRVGSRLLVTPSAADPAAASSAADPAVAAPRTVLDAATGRPGGTFTWHSLGPVRADGALPVVRVDTTSARAYYGMLDVETLAIRVRGVAEQAVGDCGGAAGVLVCRRVDSSYGVWRFDAS